MPDITGRPGLRETQAELWVQKGVLSPNSSNRGRRGEGSPNFSVRAWVDNLLTLRQVTNADGCCSQFAPSGKERTAVAINTTALGTVAKVTSGIRSGFITSTSAAAVTLTTDTATNMATAFGATAGATFDFYVDNSAGSNTITVAVGSGVTVGTVVITGGGTLTVSTANVVGHFQLYFTSTTAAILRRIS